MILSKIAATAALGIALFPCDCDGHDQIIPYVHGISAAIMFIVLAWFCLIFYRRARAKGHAEARRRAFIYAASGFLIVASILVLVFYFLSGGAISEKITRLVFYGERTGLMAFGISWLTASRIFPLLANNDEKLTFFVEGKAAEAQLGT
jgi:hypothetical protein